MKQPAIRFYKQRGTAVLHNNMTLTPESQVLHLELPFGGFVWQRPTAVFVRENGQERVVPIVDVVRTAVWALWGIAGLLVMLIWLSSD